MMSAVAEDFKITPPKVKPRRGTSLVLFVLRRLVCVLGTSIFPLTVYLVEGCSNLFFWVLGFGSFISFILLIIDSGKVRDIMQVLKRSCCGVIYRRKLLQAPSSYKNLSPLKPSAAAQNSPDSQILDVFDLPQSTTPVFIDIPISIERPSSYSSPGELIISQTSTILTPTKRRMISPSASVSLSPLKNQTDASGMRSPFSKRRLGFPGCLSPRHPKDTKHLSTILESPYPDGIVDNFQSRRPNCFST